MKKSLLFISALVAGATSFAQVIPNGNFESWTGTTTATGWSDHWSTNGYISGTYPTTAKAVGGNAKVGNAAMMVYSTNIGPGTLPGISVLGSVSNPAYTNITLAATPTQTVQGSIPLTTRPVTLSGFAKYVTGASNQGTISAQVYLGGNIISTGGANTYTVNPSSGYVNFNLPLTYTVSGTTADSVRIILSNVTSAEVQSASTGDTLYVDVLRFLSCTPDAAIVLGSTPSITSDDGHSGISSDGALTITASSSYIHTFTTATPNPSIITTGGQTVTLSPLDSVVWSPVTNTNTPALIYTPGEPSATSYGNSKYCFTISGTLPATMPASYTLQVKQTPYGTLNTASYGSTTVPVGSLGGIYPINLTNTKVDSILLNVPSPLATPTVTATTHTLTSTTGTTYQWYWDGNAISGATAQSYVAIQNGLYSVVVTNSLAQTSSPSSAVLVSDILSCTLNPSVTLATQGIKSDNGSSGISADGILSLPASAAGSAYNHTFTVAIQDPTITTQAGQTVTITPLDSIRWAPINLPSGLTYTGGSATNLSYGKSIYCFTIMGSLPTTTNVTYKWLIDQTPYGMISANNSGVTVTTTIPVGNFGGIYPINLTNTAIDSIVIKIGAMPTDVPTLDANTFGVLQNVPNPFSGTTSISFSTPNSGTVQFTVVDLLGRVVNSQTINANAGVNTITYAAGSDSGTYFYTISDGVHSVTKKLVVSK